MILVRNDVDQNEQRKRRRKCLVRNSGTSLGISIKKQKELPTWQNFAQKDNRALVKNVGPASLTESGDTATIGDEANIEKFWH
jgi:hypothetical protein